MSDEEKIKNTAEESVIEAELVDESDAVETSESSGEEPTISLEDQLAAAKAEAEDFRDRWMRSQAEFANARKRMERERTELYAMATTDVIKKLLPVIDDFSRAMSVVPEEVSNNTWFDGVELVQRKLEGLLEAVNVSPIEAVGEPFDPNFHEAINQEESEEHESGHVCRELQKGYRIGDRVVRPSLVSVAA